MYYFMYDGGKVFDGASKSLGLGVFGKRLEVAGVALVEFVEGRGGLF